jgi:hypothetical protein
MTEHVKTLEKAREQMIKARRELAEQLSKYHNINQPQFRTAFIEVQSTIEQIDKAIAEEQKVALAAPPKASASDSRYTTDVPEHPERGYV